MTDPLRRLLPNVATYVEARIVAWRTGSSEGQRAVWLVLATLSIALLVLSLLAYSVVPAAWFVVPMLLGTLTLRHRPLVSLVGLISVCVAATVTTESIQNGMAAGRLSTLAAMAVIALVVLYDSSHRRSDLPRSVGEGMLLDLRDRLQSQGTVPALPAGWSSQSAMKYAGGTRFSGDFLVATLSDDESTLEMVLVDVCGKGVAAGTRSLQLAGALGGMIGALPPLGLFAAANDFLLRQKWDEGFATAVHVIVDLPSGRYSIISAGHPPALRWDATTAQWDVDGARGLALGITTRPEFHRTDGLLHPGDALMFYTDGVVESRSRDVMTGVEWLRSRAREIVQTGFDRAPQRIMAEVEAGDDRAILLLARVDPTLVGAPVPKTVSRSRR